MLVNGRDGVSELAGWNRDVGLVTLAPLGRGRRVVAGGGHVAVTN